MWAQTQISLDGELSGVTTSIWHRTEYPHAYVGVMRPYLLAPPYLWFMLDKPETAPLRKVRGWLDELQEVLIAPEVCAEAHGERNRRFLRFCGFSEISPETFMRSV